MDPMSIGMIAGSLAGAGGGFMQSREDKKAREANRPKRRKLSALQDLLQNTVDRRTRTLAVLAQSHLDYANMF